MKDDAVLLRLACDTDDRDLVILLHLLYHGTHYRIRLDVSGLSRLGTTEFRVLRSYAERSRQRGGFLKLEKANPHIAALARDYGCGDLLVIPPDEPAIQPDGAALS